MAQQAEAADTVLIVDDEEPVRRTFREWLAEAHLGVNILTAADAEGALRQANEQCIDLAILDWALGAGEDGLSLLRDLREYQPDIVAIMITGYANKATPLDAMRMGVRDYFDKNQNLKRETFQAAVEKQLDQIRPAKRERRLNQSLWAFRESVEKILPLVQSTAALNDPVPLPDAVRGLLRFLMESTHAADAVLLARHYDPKAQPTERLRAYDAQGQALEVELVPFARSIAATVVSLQEPCIMERLEQNVAAGNVQLQPFERNRRSLLAAPLTVAAGIHVVLELFDRRGPGGEAVAFTDADQRLVRAAAGFGTELLRQALAHKQTHQVLLDAVGAALRASEGVAATLGGSAGQRPEAPPPAAVMDQLRQGLSAAPGSAVDADDSLRLAEAIRVLALRHGTPAVRHCTRLVEQLRELLDAVCGVS
jgi:ActR/RegA family two-component response regulator